MNRHWQEFLAISYLFSPLLIGLTAHGVCIKFGWLNFLTGPIDRGNTFRGKRIFGANKTYRGIACVAAGTALGFALQAYVLHEFDALRRIELLDYTSDQIVDVGLLLGIASMLGELVNSFVKRQLGIAPGAAAAGRLNLFFYVFDQIDFLLGAWLVLGLMVSVSFERVAFSALFIFVSHQALSFFGHRLGMRQTAG
jgi:CDP-2,3-bis-(O-geranylgeranyl)-sn-glycerol synthase